jgi:hypothetical protein
LVFEKSPDRRQFGDFLVVFTLSATNSQELPCPRKFLINRGKTGVSGRQHRCRAKSKKFVISSRFLIL